MAFYGADPDELDKLSKEMAAAAKNVALANSQLSGALAKAAGWTGPAADRFRSDWRARYSPTLVSTGHSLESVGSDLTRNAREQRSTSEVGAAESGPANMAAIAQMLHGFYNPVPPDSSKKHHHDWWGDATDVLDKGSAIAKVVAKHGPKVVELSLTPIGGEALAAGYLLAHAPGVKGVVIPLEKNRDFTMVEKPFGWAEKVSKVSDGVGFVAIGMSMWSAEVKEHQRDELEHPGWNPIERGIRDTAAGLTVGGGSALGDYVPVPIVGPMATGWLAEQLNERPGVALEGAIHNPGNPGAGAITALVQTSQLPQHVAELPHRVSNDADKTWNEVFH